MSVESIKRKIERTKRDIDAQKVKITNYRGDVSNKNTKKSRHSFLCKEIKSSLINSD